MTILHAGIETSASEKGSTNENFLRRNAAENIFLDGKIAERNGDSTEARQLFLSAWKLDPASDFLTSYASNFALHSNEPVQAIYVITGGLPTKTLNDQKLRELAKIYITYEHYSEALDAFKEIDTMDLQDSVVYADLLAENNQFREAAKIIVSANSEGDSLLQLKAADLYRRAGDGSVAINLFRDLEKQYPNDRAIRKGLGLSLLAFGSEADAMNILDWYLPVKGGIPDQQVMELVGRYYASKRQYRDAIILFQQLYKNDGTPRDFYYGRPLAIYSFLDGRLEYAQNIMTQLLSIQKDDYELHFLFGSVSEALEKTDQAIDSYLTSIKFNPNFEEPYRALVLLYVRTGKTEQAVASALNYTQKFASKPESWALYGSLLTMQQKYSEAVMPFSEALKIYGKLAPLSIQFEYAMCLERSGKTNDAEQLFSKLAYGNPVHLPSANYLGYMWVDNNKNISKATKLIKIALDGDPENGAYLDSYGWALYRQKNYEQALLHLYRALEQINDDYIIYYHIGMTLEQMGRLAESISEYEKANVFENPQRSEISEKITKLQSLLSEQKFQSTEN